MIQSTKKEVFWAYLRWIDFIMQMMIEMNIFEHLATPPGHGGSFKNHKNAFLSD